MNDDEFRQWIEAEHQLSELERKPEYQTLKDLVQARIDELQRRVLSGHVTVIEDYKGLVARIAAMHEVLNMRATVAQVVKNERERRSEASSPDAA